MGDGPGTRLSGTTEEHYRRRDGTKQKSPLIFISGLSFLAEWTGLEPATPGVTGRYSNQLNYHSVLVCHLEQ